MFSGNYGAHRAASRRMIVLAALSATGLPSAASLAANVTQTVTDAAGTSSFNTGLHWSDGLAPAAGNTYQVVSTTASVSLRTPFDLATDIAFAGDSLTLTGTTAFNSVLVMKNATNTTTTVNNITLDGGRIENGGTSTGAATSLTFLSNGITLGTNGGTINAGAGGRTLNINSTITGTGGLLTVNTTGGTVNLLGAISGSGNVTFNAAGGLITSAVANSFTGNTIISGSTIAGGGVSGAVRLNDGVNFPTAGSLTLNGGNLETSVDITRNLGTAAGEISITGTASGFSAVGAPVTVAIGGIAAPTALTWGSATFNPTNLVVADFNSNNTLTFANAIDLGTATRTIYAASGTAATQSILTGAITGTGGINVFGGSTLVFANSGNTFSGTVTIGANANNTTQSFGGVARATANNALGTGTIVIGSAGNSTTGRLEVANNVVLANPITQNSRANTTVAIESISGNNELSGTIGITSGGVNNFIQSDADTLTLSGASAAAGGIALQSVGGARNVTLQGAGNGVISGIVRDSNAVAGATIAITKAGAGTWTLTNANTYTGATTVNAGTLQLGDGTSGRDGTIATTSGVTVASGATLAFNRFGDTTAAYVISGAGNVSKSGPGNQTLTGNNTYTGTTTVNAGKLTATSATYTNILANGGLDLKGGIAVLDYTSTTSPVGQVQTILTGGYAGNFASGQIRATALPAGQTIGYGDDGAGKVTIRLTLPGDADLNGQVNFNDFLALQNNFGVAGARFDQGNFNYDGQTDFNDFLVLQNNFGSSVTGSPVAFTAAQVAAMQTFAATVPEPTALAALGLGAAAALRRRRR